jgi:hypothetical protein
MNALMTTGLLQDETICQPRFGKRITTNAPTSKSRIGRQRECVDDSLIWATMGELLFSGESKTSYRSEILDGAERLQAPLAEGDDDSLIWDIMGRLVFPEPVP